MAIGVGQQLEQQFAANPEAYQAYKGMAVEQHFNNEWDRFAKNHKDANELRYRMGEYLHSPQNAQRNGESMRQALNRAYKALKATEPRNENEERRAAAKDAWESIYGR
jgi:hypothetical protein